MIEALAHAGIPTIPVQVFQDEDGRWRKLPLAKWDQATADRGVLEKWWAQWPKALPGIPLSQVGWAVIDLDDYADQAFRAEWVKPNKVVSHKGRATLEPEPYSIYKTPSGGRHIVFTQPDPPISGRMKWSAGVEVLGEGCLLTVHDVDAILYPRVAQRAVLPEVFRTPYEPREGIANVRSGGDPINNHERVVEHTPQEVAVVKDALFALDPRGWRGEHDGWLSLANACKFEGVSEDEFVRWSLGDEFYRRDERLIRRKWRSLSPKHSGALWAALSEAGIKVRPAGYGSQSATVIDGAPTSNAKINPIRKTLSWPSRVSTMTSILHSKQDNDTLFWASCVCAEVHEECGKPSLDQARKWLEEACPKFAKQVGIDEVRRIIANAFDHIACKSEQA